MPFTHATETAFMKGGLAIETVYGTAVDATVGLGAVTITPAIKRTTNKFSALGILLPAVQSIGREHTEISFEGKATYQDLPYFVYDVVSDSQIDPITLQRVYTVESAGLQIPGAIITGWTLHGNRDEITLSGSMIGKKAVVHASSAPAVAAQTAISASEIAISVGGAVANLFEWDLSVSDMWGGATYIGDSEFATIMQKQITGAFKFKVEADTTGLAFLSVGTLVACTITATEGAHSLTITFNAMVGEPGSFSDEEGIYAIEHNLTVMNTATTAIDVTIV
jgi:hypothetical protein